MDSLHPNARSLGTNPPSCFSSPSAPLLSTPAHCLFLRGRHPAYLCISCLLACLDPARKSAKRAGGHQLKSHQSSCSVTDTRPGRAEMQPGVQSWPGALVRQQSPETPGLRHTQQHNSLLLLLKVMEIVCGSLAPEANFNFCVAASCSGQLTRGRAWAQDIPVLRTGYAVRGYKVFLALLHGPLAIIRWSLKT